MDTVSDTIKHTLDLTCNQLTEAIKQHVNNELQKHAGEVQELQRELEDLRSYKDVSLVNKLTVQVDQLQKENAQLRKRVGSSSIYTNNTKKNAPELEPKPKPVIAVKKHDEVGPHDETNQEPEPEPEQTNQEQEQTYDEPEQVQDETNKEPEHDQDETNQEPTQTQAQEPELDEQSNQEPEPEPEPELDLFLVDNLESGQYFWEPDTGNLYEKVSDEEAGDVVGKIKTIKVRDVYYYQDTIDNHVYQYIKDTGDIGAKCGRIVNGKFVKN